MQRERWNHAYGHITSSQPARAGTLAPDLGFAPEQLWRSVLGNLNENKIHNSKKSICSYIPKSEFRSLFVIKIATFVHSTCSRRTSDTRYRQTLSHKHTLFKPLNLIDISVLWTDSPVVLHVAMQWSDGAFDGQELAPRKKNDCR